MTRPSSVVSSVPSQRVYRTFISSRSSSRTHSGLTLSAYAELAATAVRTEDPICSSIGDGWTQHASLSFACVVCRLAVNLVMQAETYEEQGFDRIKYRLQS